MSGGDIRDVFEANAAKPLTPTPGSGVDSGSAVRQPDGQFDAWTDLPNGPYERDSMAQRSAGGHAPRRTWCTG